MENGSITAAVILAAIISIITLIIGRGSKISELRQAWINDQRADLSKWAAAALAIARNQTGASRASDFNVLEEAAFRIRLRENPRKQEWKPVIDKMDAVRAALVAARSGEDVAIFEDLISIGALSQDRLKKDWNKVRFGELGYRVMILFFPMLFAALFLYVYYGLFPDQNPFSHKSENAAAQQIGGSMPSDTLPAGKMSDAKTPANNLPGGSSAPEAN